MDKENNNSYIKKRPAIPAGLFALSDGRFSGVGQRLVHVLVLQDRPDLPIHLSTRRQDLWLVKL
jgi:hypothetical protein